EHEVNQCSAVSSQPWRMVGDTTTRLKSDAPKLRPKSCPLLSCYLSRVPRAPRQPLPPTLSFYLGNPVTIDEELNLLDQQLRRLKIEYEIFFNNPSKRPPSDVEWKVLSLIRKFSDGARLSFSQRFRYNEMAQRYAIQSDLWRKKTRIREEGLRRPQDALLSVQGVRPSEVRAAKRPVYGLSHSAHPAGSETPPGSESGHHSEPPFSVQCSGASDEHKQVESLYKALAGAKQKS